MIVIGVVLYLLLMVLACTFVHGGTRKCSLCGGFNCNCE